MRSPRPKYVSSPIGILVRFLFAGRPLAAYEDKAGFTLIEVVASLLIVGILGAIAGMGLVTGLRGYMQAKENGHLAQKAQIAMARIKRELMEITDVIAVSKGTDPSIIFDNPAGRQALRKVGNTVQLCSLEPTKTNLDGVVGDTLIDQIDQEDQEKNFRIAYRSGSGDWDIGNDIDLLSTIDVTFVLRREEGRAGSEGTVPFNTTVSLRNTRNAGGATINDDDVARVASKYDCFIESAGAGIFPTTSLPAKRAFLTVFVLWLFWITSFTDCRRPKRRQQKIFKGSSGRNQCGHVLVGLVVTLLLFSALGAGMVSLIGTSATSQVAGDTASRAYYLAESGFRYAASRYLNATDADGICKSKDEKSQTLENLHEKSFILSNDDGLFQLKVFPYFLTVNGTPALGGTAVATRFSGGKPKGFALPSTGVNARVKIGATVYPYSYYNDDTGQLTLSEPLAQDACDGTFVKLVGFPTGSATVSKNGDLSLADGGFFPETQGKVTIHGVSYGYKSRDDNILRDVTKVQDSAESFSVSVDTTTEVVLEPFVQVRSVGIVGQGELSSAREVIYSVPLPDKSKEIVEFRDDFSDLSHWNAPTYGSFAIENREGENVLAVTAVEPGLGVLKAGLIAFNWATDNIVNFAYAHRLAGYYLSYDTQVKIGFDETPFPDTGYRPEGSPIPRHYAAGISFRLDDNENFYGLSFMRGCRDGNPSCNPPDRIDNPIVPEDDVNLIVLWQQTGNGTSRKWLAFSELGLLFSDGAELEPPSGKWISENDHPGSPLWTRADNFAHSGYYSWTTSPSGTGTYTDPPVGETWNDYQISEPIDLSQANEAELIFRTRYRMASCEDWGFVEISDDGGSSWDLLNDKLPQECGGIEPDDSSYAGYTGNSDALPGEEGGWVKKALDISGYAGNSSVRIRFRFERNCCVTSDGWWVDNIRVIQDFPVDRSTLLVRIYEGALVAFNSGGTTPIEEGDFVQSNGAIGQVIAPPLLSSGSWAGGNAAGTLLLNNTSDTAFASGLPLYKGATAVATVTGFSARENLIQAYYGAYGTESGVYPPPTSPAPDGLYQYDQERLRNSFGTANWPPNPSLSDDYEPPSGTNDFYTLVQWNDAVDSSATRVKDNDGRYSIIITDTLTSPTTYFPFTRPEIGLHVAGHGGANVYFKDFAVKMGYAAQQAMIPIQQ